jgi:hypothetical protein
MIPNRLGHFKKSGNPASRATMAKPYLAARTLLDLRSAQRRP